MLSAQKWSFAKSVDSGRTRKPLHFYSQGAEPLLMSLLFRGVNPATLLFYAFPACVSRIFKYKSLHGMRTSSHGGWNYYIPNFLLCFLVETRNKIDRPIPKIGIQIGERTHIHDQAIIPVNFSTTKTMAINTERYHPLGKLFLFIIFFSCLFFGIL